MNKKKLHHHLGIIRKLNSFLLLGLCIACAVIALLALRSNNQNMIRLREAVFVADKNDGDIEGALMELRTYVYGHMNTNLSSGRNAVKPPIQLKFEYERLNAAAKAQYEAESAKVVADATATCTQSFPGDDINLQRFACAQAYGAAHPVTLKTVPEELYKFDFASPFWSPDLAGWSIVASGVFLLLFVIRSISTWVIKQELS